MSNAFLPHLTRARTVHQESKRGRKGIATHREETVRRAKQREEQKELQLLPQQDIAKNVILLVEELRQIRLALVAIVKSNKNPAIGTYDFITYPSASAHWILAVKLTLPMLFGEVWLRFPVKVQRMFVTLRS